MPESPTAHEQAERDRLADVIVRRRNEIELRWLALVSEQLQRRDISPSELRDSMPDYMLRVADGLRHTDHLVGPPGGSSSDDIAREHATTRVRLGFDIDQLVREFIVLRRVLFAVLEEEGVALDSRVAGQIADIIEGAIAAAVKSYVESRDYQARKGQAEHVAFITHELRNPLSSAKLALHHLREGLTLTGTQEITLGIVERNLHRLGELIDSVLVVERGAHALHPHAEVLSLGQILQEPLVAGEIGAQAKHLRFHARFDPEVVVCVDASLTVSAIDNVLQNAVKYTDDGEIEVLVEETPRDVVIHVRDSCPGISKAELRTIFEPFVRGHSAKPGTGLGLAIARRALEVQGGSIDAESSGSKGCHFWLTLPKPPH